MAKCDHCPLRDDDRPCKVEITRHYRYCEMVDPNHPAYEPAMADRLLAFSGEGVPARKPPALPLAGDLVAALTARIGADRAAEWISDKLGKDCGCATRRAALNRLDAKLRSWLGIGSP